MNFYLILGSSAFHIPYVYIKEFCSTDYFSLSEYYIRNYRYGFSSIDLKHKTVLVSKIVFVNVLE